MAMHIVDNDSFLSQAAKQGVVLDDRYAEPRTLGYQNDFWLAVPMPSDVRKRQVVLSVTLGLFPDESPVWVWRRGGVWWLGDRYSADQVLRHVHQAVRTVFSVADVEDGVKGTLRSDGNEKGLLFALILMNSLTAWSVREDLFLVPDSSGLVIYFDHHDQIILQCRDQHVYDTIGESYLAELQRLGIAVDSEPDAKTDKAQDT